jgi:hypothetical protein
LLFATTRRNQIIVAYANGSPLREYPILSYDCILTDFGRSVA